MFFEESLHRRSPDQQNLITEHEALANAASADSGKAYSAYPSRRGLKAVIAERPTRSAPREALTRRDGRPRGVDAGTYRDRHMEGPTPIPSSTRAAAARCDNRDYVRRGRVGVAATWIWLRARSMICGMQP